MDNHLPPDKHFTAVSQLPITVKLHSIPNSHPIPKATMTFSDVNISRYRSLIQRHGEKDTINLLPHPGSVQLGELFRLLKIFECCQQEQVNIFSDSQYAVQALCTLSFSYIKEQNSPIRVCMCSLQKALENRAHLWFISQIR